MLSFLFLLLGCVKEELVEEDKLAFEGEWWETDCPLPGCPICFMLEEGGSLVILKLEDETLWLEEGWWFEEPNKYHMEYGGLIHTVKVEANGECFRLQYGLIIEDACKCPRGEELWSSPL